LSEPAADSDKQERTPTLLIVDDDPSTAKLIRQWFADTMDIVEAGDGLDGVQRAIEGQPDLLLLDLRMPGLDGIGVARQLKDDPRTSTIPILVMSACRDTESKVEAFTAGADDYVTKPCELMEVEARLRSLLKKREALLQIEQVVQNLSSTNERLEQSLMVDEKTGLYNFREFQRRLKAEWARAERYRVPLSLVFFDLDHFKTINDTLGHQPGDKILEEFAVLATGGARANDVAARYGGEEFAIILPRAGAAEAVTVAERLRDRLSGQRWPDHPELTVTASFGVSELSMCEESTAERMVELADKALYIAKQSGRDRVMIIHDNGDEPDARATA